jgi:hypothetical protein
MSLGIISEIYSLGENTRVVSEKLTLIGMDEGKERIFSF